MAAVGAEVAGVAVTAMVAPVLAAGAVEVASAAMATDGDSRAPRERP